MSENDNIEIEYGMQLQDYTPIDFKGVTIYPVTYKYIYEFYGAINVLLYDPLRHPSIISTLPRLYFLTDILNHLDDEQYIKDKTYWESLQKQVEDYYDNEIKKLQEIADEEERINKQEELRNNLIKARQDLENAKKNKNQLVFVDGHFEYREDQDAVLSASEKVDDAEQAIVDYNRETEITLLEEQKNNATEFYKNILEKFDNYLDYLDGKDIPTASDTEVMGAVSDYAGSTPKRLYTISEAADIICKQYGIDKNSDVWKNFATNVVANNPPILPMPSIQNNNIYNNNYNTPVSVNGVNVSVSGGISQKEAEDIVSDGIETFARNLSGRLNSLAIMEMGRRH